jgi:hypothetical protein
VKVSAGSYRCEGTCFVMGHANALLVKEFSLPDALLGSLVPEWESLQHSEDPPLL